MFLPFFLFLNECRRRVVSCIKKKGSPDGQRSVQGLLQKKLLGVSRNKELNKTRVLRQSNYKEGEKFMEVKLRSIKVTSDCHPLGLERGRPWLTLPEGAGGGGWRRLRQERRQWCVACVNSKGNKGQECRGELPKLCSTFHS